MPFKYAGTTNFYGGLNTREDPQDIPANSFKKFRNITTFNGTLRKRDGSTRVTDITHKKLYQLASDRYMYITFPANDVQNNIDQSDSSWMYEIQYKPPSNYTSQIQPLLFYKQEVGSSIYSWLLYIDTDDRIKLAIDLTSPSYIIGKTYLVDLGSLGYPSDYAGTYGILNIGWSWVYSSTGSMIALMLNGRHDSLTYDEFVGTRYSASIPSPFNLFPVHGSGNAPAKLYIGYYDGTGGTVSSSAIYAQGHVGDIRIWRRNNPNGYGAQDHKILKKWAFSSLPSTMHSDLNLYYSFEVGTAYRYKVYNGGAYRVLGTVGDNYATAHCSHVDGMSVSTDLERSSLKSSLSSYIFSNKYLVADTSYDIYAYDMTLQEVANEYCRNASSGVKSDSTVIYDRLYIADGGRLLRKNQHYTDVAGVHPPGLTFGIQTTGGSLTAGGTYKWRATFIDEDGFESNPSNELTQTMSGSNNAVYIRVTYPRERRVQKVRLYRTTNGGTVFYQVFEYDVWQYTNVQNSGGYTPADTMFILYDPTADIDLNTGITIPTDNSVPPNCKYVEAYYSMLMLSGDSQAPSRVYYSTTLSPEYFPSLNYIDVGEGSGGSITGLASSRGLLYIFKERSIWMLSGRAPNEFRLDYVDTNVGCIAPHSITKVTIGGAEVIFFASQDGIYMLNTANAQVMSIGENIKDFYLSLDFTLADNWVGVHNKQYNQYILYCSEAGANRNNIALVYDYIYKSWSLWDSFVEGATLHAPQSALELYTLSVCLQGDKRLILFKENQAQYYQDKYLMHRSGVSLVDTRNKYTGLIAVLFDELVLSYEVRLIEYFDGFTFTFDKTPSISYSHILVGVYPVEVETGHLVFDQPHVYKLMKGVEINYYPARNSAEFYVQASSDYRPYTRNYRYIKLDSRNGFARFSVKKRGRVLTLRILNIDDKQMELSSLIYGYIEKTEKQFKRKE